MLGHLGLGLGLTPYMLLLPRRYMDHRPLKGRVVHKASPKLKIVEPAKLFVRSPWLARVVIA